MILLSLKVLFFFWKCQLNCFSDITVLLSLTVFHKIVKDTLPQVSDSVPVIGTDVHHLLLLHVVPGSHCDTNSMIKDTNHERLNLVQNHNTRYAYIHSLMTVPRVGVGFILYLIPHMWHTLSFIFLGCLLFLLKFLISPHSPETFVPWILNNI